MKIQALETALNTNQSFAELYEQATQHVRTDELIRAHEAALHVLDALIDRLKGGAGLAEA